MPVLDTTYLLDLEDRASRLEAFHGQLASMGEALVVPAQVAIEYTAGLVDPAAGFRRLRASYTLAPADEAVMLEAGRLAQQAFALGQFPGWADIQIGATARQLGMAVVTANARHFAPLGIEVLAYPV